MPLTFNMSLCFVVQITACTLTDFSLVTDSPYVCLDSGFSHPLYSKKHQQEPWSEGLAMVEALYHSAAPH